MFAEISKDKSINAERLASLGGGISGLALGLQAFAAIDSTGLAANALSAGLIAKLPDSGSFSRALDLTTKSENNALAKTGGGDTYNTINNTDNSLNQNQTTAITAPENPRHNIQKEYG